MTIGVVCTWHPVLAAGSLTITYCSLSSLLVMQYGSRKLAIDWLCATGDSQIPKFPDFRIHSFQDPWFGLHLARSTHRQEFNQLTLINCSERCWRDLAARAPVSTLANWWGCTVVLFTAPCSCPTWHPMCALSYCNLYILVCQITLCCCFVQLMTAFVQTAR